MRKKAGHTLAVKTITTHLSLPSLIFLTTIIYSEKNMVSFRLPLLSSWLILFKFYLSNDFSFPPSNPGALFFDSALITMKKCNNKTSFLLCLPFAQGWQSFSVLRIWFIWWPPSESPGAHSHSHSPLKARGDLLQPCRAGGESQDCSGWVHSQGVSSTLVARRSCGLAGASSLSLLGWQQLAGHGEALLALCFPPVSVQGQSVCLWAEEQRARTCPCGQGRKKKGWVWGGVVWKESS